MNRFFRCTEGILCIVLIFLLLGALGGTVWISGQMESVPAFHGLTIELGDDLPPIGQFLTEYGDAEKAYLVTLESEIDLTQVGDRQLTFCQNGKEETVVLSIRDTTAPAVVFRDLTLALGTAPQAEDLVLLAEDLSPVTVSFAEAFTVPENYGPVTVEVRVSDAWGNTTTGTCCVRYVWLREQVTVELGDTLEIGDLLMREADAAMFTDQAAVDEINTSGVGSYTVISVNANMTCQCSVTVQDTVAPALETKQVLLGLGDTAQVEDFVVSAVDASENVTLTLASQPDFELLGNQTVVVEARDPSGNVATAEAVLEIREDIQAPVIQGMDNMRVEIGSRPNYTLGVVAVDNRDGYVEFTYDASQENTSKSGGYYVTYTATDKAGNTATVRRWIIVDHDQADIDALVAKYADKLPDDPVEISKWLQRNIWYTADWGNGDPVWFGFTKWVGNCYVHAYCLQAMLQNKGYETQIVWTTDESHYWVMLDIGDGVWRHLDSTPGEIHTRYGLMDDWQRLATLSGGRSWDFDAWPRCLSETE